MNKHRKLYALAAAAVAVEVAAYLAWRPRMLRWGTEGDESTEKLPGDDLVPQPRVQSTRAITIDAPPEQVWPWIVQMGIGRATARRAVVAVVVETGVAAGEGGRSADYPDVVLPGAVGSFADHARS